MAEEPPKKKTETSGRLGATGEAVKANVRRLRDAQGLSAAQLSKKLGQLDRPIPLVGIQRIEAGTRRVDADDLAALAVALEVSPVTLLMPHTEAPDDQVRVTGLGDMPGGEAWSWMSGERSFLPGLGNNIVFYRSALPPWVWAERQDEIDKMIGEVVTHPRVLSILRNEDHLRGDDK